MPKPPPPLGDALAGDLLLSIVNVMRFCEEFEPDDAKRWAMMRDALEAHIRRPRQRGE